MATYSTLEACKPNIKVQTDIHNELLYADDIDKNASSEAKCKMQNAKKKKKKKKKKKYKEPWIKSRSHMITIISQSEQKDRGSTPTSTWRPVQ